MVSCSAPAAALAGAASACPTVRYLVTGTFNTALLYLLSYDTLTHRLSIARSIPAQGPHQYLALGRGPEQRPDRLYATTWAWPPSLSSWAVEGIQGADGEGPDLRWINTKNITATSSYVHVYPPAYPGPSAACAPGNGAYLLSAGGPTGEVHTIDEHTGAIGERAQEIVFLKEGEKALEQADKTRKALRYGAHNVDIGPNNIAFVADLGRNAILLYEHDPATGKLTLRSECPSPHEGDGPRHVVPSKDGKRAYAVTEHTSWVDVYELSGTTMKHVQRASVIPDGLDRHAYRGDTVRLSPSGRSLLASTRGMHAGTRGFVRAWALSESSGLLSSPDSPLHTYETPSSGGKANAIEFAPSPASVGASVGTGDERKGKDLAVLTDDEQGWVLVLEWDGSDLREMSRVRLPGTDEDGKQEGASHAIWLS